MGNVDYRNNIIDTVSRQLNGDFSETLTKFSYLGNGAKNFLKLAQSPNYLGYSREILLIDKIRPFLTQFEELIDLGPGDGRKACKIINQACNYLAMDISCEMLEIARHNQDAIDNRVYEICDFSDFVQLRQTICRRTHVKSRRLLMILGNTLANETNMEIFLRNLGQLVRNDDCLLVGMELLCDTDRILLEYRDEQNCLLTVKPLEAIGISTENGVLNITFNELMNRVEEWFIFTRNTIINPYVGLEAGDKILLSVTHKPSLLEITEIFRNSGWTTVAYELVESQAIFLLRATGN